MLTDKQLSALKPRSKEYIVADALGLGIRIWPSGAKAFQYRYRINGKLERLTIGTYPEVSLKEARERLADARKKTEQGISPAYEKQLTKGPTASAGIETVKDLADEFMGRFVRKERKRPKPVQQMLDADVLRVLGKLKVKDITRRHVVKMLDEIVDRGSRVQANRTASISKQMFQFAVERGLIDSNPCSDIRRQTIGGTEKSRDRNLNRDEIKTFWKNISEVATRKPEVGETHVPIGIPMAIALKVLLVTAQRRGELTKAKWVDIDYEGKIWTIPAENSKNGRLHKVALSSLAVRLFKELKSHAGDSAFVLPSPQHVLHGDAPTTDRSLTKAAKPAQAAVGIAKWVPHDLRRTAASQLAGLGIPPHVVEKIQNHTMQGVMAVYNRYDYSKECRSALELWSKEILRVTK